jgi:opacity protein-like surface antigen
MNIFAECKKGDGIRGRLRAWGLLYVALIFIGLAAPRHAAAQVVESANAPAAHLSVGTAASAFTLGYGDRKMVGVTAWVDGDIEHFGIEGEGRWLDFHETANVHAETYLGGLRYHLTYHRTQPYVKALAGLGYFNFPYNYATGRYFVISGGGGLDYKLNRRLIVRAEFEYQNWPQFTYGAMNSAGFNVGVRYRIF